MNGRFRVRGRRLWPSLSQVAGWTVIGLVVGVVPAWGQDDKLPKAEKILEKSIEGRGGRGAFEKQRTRVSKGTIEVSGAGPSVKGTLEQYEEAPNKKYLVMDLGPSGKIEVGTDGEVHWDLSTQGGANIRTGEEKAISERQSFFNALLLWKEQYEKVETVGKEQVDEHPCYKVVMTPKVGAPETVYFDRRTGFPVKLEQVRKRPTGDITIMIRQEEFKDFDGVQLPCKITRQASSGGQTQTFLTTWQSIEHNVDIPASRFALPDAVKAVLEKSKGQAGDATGKKEGS